MSICGPPATAGRERLRQKRNIPPAASAMAARIHGRSGKRCSAGVSEVTGNAGAETADGVGVVGSADTSAGMTGCGCGCDAGFA
jgi:hypothetical protein